MARKEEFTFPSKDGRTEVQAAAYIPDNGDYGATLQITHGMVEYFGRYEAFARFLADEGFRVVGHDHVGHGSSVVSEEDLGYVGDHPSDIWINDMHTLRGMCQEEDRPYFMLGHSMGSYLLRQYLSLHGENLTGAIIMGTGYMPEGTVKAAMNIAKFQAAFLGWRHRSRLLQKLSYGKPYKKFCLDGSDLKNTWLTRDEEIARKYYSDPKCTFVFTDNAYMGLFEAVLSSCSRESISRLPKDLPVFLVSGQDDPVGDLGIGVKKVYDLYQEAGLTDVTWQLYENDRHEILNELDREKVYKDILSWMNVRIG